MVAGAGAGPMPIPQRDITAESLSQAIRFCLSPEAASAAAVIAQKMQSERGVEAAVMSFHRNLPIKDMSCDVLPRLPYHMHRFKNVDWSRYLSIVKLL
jgi:hypothetical protein